MDTKDRLNYLSSLTEFIEEKAEKLQTFCYQLGWSAELETTDSLQLCECPFDPGHWIPPNSLAQHKEHCQLSQRGYKEDEVLFPPAYKEGGPVVALSQEKQFDIIQASAAKNPSIPTVSAPPEVPQSASRLVASLTTQQRLALYEHVASKTAEQRPGILKYTEVDLAFDEKPEESGGEKSFWEVLAQQRDAKRRRLNYRQAKKVHTKHKSQTEVTREVIENQMELYTEWLQQNNPDAQAKGRQSTEETEDTPTFQSVYEDKCSFQYEFQNNRKEKCSDREKYSCDRSHDRHNHSHSSRHKHEYTDRSRSSSKYRDHEDRGRDHSRKHRGHRESRSHSRSDDRHSRKKHKHSSKR